MLKRATTSLAIAAISALSLMPMAGAASARDYGRHGGHGPRTEFRHFDKRGNDYRHARRGHRHYHRGGHRGGAIAIGAFAAIVGLALAAEANRVNHDRYRGYDY